MQHRYRVKFPGPDDDNDPFFNSWQDFQQKRSRRNTELCGHFTEARPQGIPARNVWPTLVIGSECLRLQDPQGDSIRTTLITILRDISAQLSRGTSTDATPFNPLDALKFVGQLVQDRLGFNDDVDEACAEVAPTPTDSPTARGQDTRGTASDHRHQAATHASHRAPAGEKEPPVVSYGGVPPLAADVRPEPADPLFKTWEIRLIVAAAAVTKCYFGAKAHSLHSVSRWTSEYLRLSPQDETNYVIDAVTELVNSPDLVGTNSRLLDIARDVRDRLHKNQIAQADLLALTEIAWSAVARPFALYSWYPEWPEFLVRLSLDVNSRRLRQGPPRPAVRSTLDAALMVTSELADTTKQSAEQFWPERAADVETRETPRLDTYTRFAELLCGMARARLAKQSTPASDAPMEPIFGLADGDSRLDDADSEGPSPKGSSRQSLPVSAFVTSFDIELELALTFTHPEQAFVMAIPVNLIDNLDGDEDRDRAATTMWLGCVVPPAEQGTLERITNPGPDAWFVFGETSPGAQESDPPMPTTSKLLGSAPGIELIRRALPAKVRVLGDLPIIIRLAGSPLIELPVIQHELHTLSALGKVAAQRASLDHLIDYENDDAIVWNVTQQPVELEFAHATLLDEHNAIRLSLPELISQHRRGLPPDLLDSQARGFWRYWMLFGVELSDPVIRYRLVSQILGAGLLSTKARYERPRRLGFALNRKPLNSRALDLLLWCGFDIVQDDEAFSSVADKLSHYVAHLEQGETARWPTPGGQCPLQQTRPQRTDSFR